MIETCSEDINSVTRRKFNVDGGLQIFTWTLFFDTR